MIRLYEDYADSSISDADSGGFMYHLFSAALAALEEGERDPKQIERWVVKSEKMWRKF